MLTDMIRTRSKPRWWFPFAVLLMPGSCYLFAAVLPTINLDFATLGAFLVAINLLLAVLRLAAFRRTLNPLFRLVAAQGVCLAFLLIALRFWLAWSPPGLNVYLWLLALLYVVCWLIPESVPRWAQTFYEELNVPKTPQMRALTRLALGLGAGAGAIGVFLGKQMARLGAQAWPILAIVLTAGLAVISIYFAAQLWRLNRNLEDWG